MKRKLWSHSVILLLIFSFSLSICFSSRAASEGEDGWMEQEALLDNVTDDAGILTAQEWESLERQAREISGKYDLGVYIITVESYRDYSTEGVFEAAMGLYKEYSLGIGEQKDGLLLLLSMDDRDYSLITYGDFGNYAFNEAGRSKMTEFFLDEFGENEWYDGFVSYLSWSEDYLETAKNGEPYSEDHEPMDASDRRMAILIRVAIILLVPLIIAGIWILVLTSQMKSVAEATRASAYISGNLRLSIDEDRYTHTTETRRKIEKDDDSKPESSDGFSGTSGKF